MIPFRGFAAVNVFGIIFVRKEAQISESLLNHEQIHTAQMKELLYIAFYVLYFSHFLFLLFKYRNPMQAYSSVCFEKEAYENQDDLGYLKRRRKYRYFKNDTE